MNQMELFRLIKAVQDGMRSNRTGMRSEEAEAFESQLNEVAQAAMDNSVDAGAVGARLVALLRDYPGISGILAETDSTVRAVLQPASPSAQNPAHTPESASTPASPPAVAGPRQEPPVDRSEMGSGIAMADAADGHSATGDAAGTAPQRAGDGPAGGGDAAAPRRSDGRWTVSGQTVRELFAGLLACAVVGAMLAVALGALGQVGNGDNVQQAKDLLTVLIGPAGVVLGYYFGRAPAETAAAQASQRADDAQADRDAVKARVRNAERSLTEEIARRSGSGRGFDPVDLDGLRRVRDQLRNI